MRMIMVRSTGNINPIGFTVIIIMVKGTGTIKAIMKMANYGNMNIIRMEKNTGNINPIGVMGN
jgi:hypothetical protein